MPIHATRSSHPSGYGTQPGSKLVGLSRCPHCSVSNPNMNWVWSDSSKENVKRVWAAYRCTSCDGVATTVGTLDGGGYSVLYMFPDAKAAHEDIPEPARTFLQQAYETLHAPDAAAVMAGSAVDAMLKSHNLVDGSLYSRIDKALEQNILTLGMADWAHSVRLGSNRPRHADADKPHVSADEAKQSVEFAEALGNFMFVLTAKINRGLDAAQASATST